MGKQSRRKKNESKRARKDDLQARREYVLEQATAQPPSDSNNNNNNGSEDEERRIHCVGDRVWCRAQDTQVTLRCIIEQIREEGEVWEGDGVEAYKYKVSPFASTDGSQDLDKHRIIYKEEELIEDVHNWSLRFEVGDEVVLFQHTDDFTGYRPFTITHLFQYVAGSRSNVPGRRLKSDYVAAYVCDPVDEHDDEEKGVFVHRDTETDVSKFVRETRYKPGDDVLVCSDKARCLPNRAFEPWLRGSVVTTHVFDYQVYAVYECLVQDRQGRTFSCFVDTDTEEHITGADASPRDRLLHGIEQNCSFNFFDQLVSLTNLDVSSFRDLVLAKAIKFASFAMIIWLREKSGVKFEELVDDKTGDTLFHQMAKSKYGARFFEGAAACHYNRNCGFNGFLFSDIDVIPAMEATNKLQRTWLEEVVESADLSCRLAEFVFSFRVGVAPDLSGMLMRDKLVSGLIGLAQSRKNRVLAKLLETSWMRATQLTALSVLTYRHAGGFLEWGSSETVMKALKVTSLKQVVESVVAFDRDWPRDDFLSLERSLPDLVQKGCHQVLRLFIGANPSLLHITRHVNLSSDLGEFRQQDLNWESDEVGRKVEIIQGSLVEHATMGRFLDFPYSLDDYNRSVLRMFGRSLQWRRDRCTVSSELVEKPVIAELVEELKDQAAKRYTGYKLQTMCKYKAYLLEDGEALEARVATLEYLVKEEGMKPPSAILVIKWRKCGILRWLVSESFVDLKKLVQKDHVLFKAAKQEITLLSGQVPKTMTVGQLLCIAAVEFDDLQSLCWLVEEHGIDIGSVKLGHWNLVHMSAHCGRGEITIWLASLTQFATVAAQPCHTKPFNAGKLFAVHLAIINGYTDIADWLLSAGCPSTDASGKNVSSYAKNSSIEYVQEWGTEREKPLQLEVKVRKLLQLLETGGAEGKMAKLDKLTSCLDFRLWEAAGFHGSDIVGPMGLSYRDMVQRCFRAVSVDTPLCLKLFQACVPASLHLTSYFLFWGVDLGGEQPNLPQESVSSILAALSNDPVFAWLKEPWAKCDSIEDPRYEPLLAHLSVNGCLTPATAQTIVETRLKVYLLNDAHHASLKELQHRLQQNSLPDEVEYVRDMLVKTTTALAAHEGVSVDVYLSSYDLVNSSGLINLEGGVHSPRSNDSFPLRNASIFRMKSNYELDKLFIFLAIQGYGTLIEWLLSGKSRWGKTEELVATRSAAMMGFAEIVDLFVGDNERFKFESSRHERRQSAILGFAEGGTLADFQTLYRSSSLRYPQLEGSEYEPEAEDDNSGIDATQRKMVREAQQVADSLCAVCVLRFMQSAASSASRKETQQILKWLAENTEYEAKQFLVKVGLVMDVALRDVCTPWLAELIEFLVTSCHLDPTECSSEMVAAANGFLNHEFLFRQKDDNWSEFLSSARDLLSSMIRYGVDVQMVGDDRFRSCVDDKNAEVRSMLLELKRLQQSKWSALDTVKQGASLPTIRQAVENGSIELDLRDRGGLLLSHLAAAYDRTDVLEWLVVDCGMSLQSRDGKKRDVQEVAQASGALKAIKWLREHKARDIISIFVSTHFRRKLASQRLQRRVRSALLVQALARGRIARNRHGSLLESRLEDFYRFDVRWGSSISKIGDLKSIYHSWASAKFSLLDMRGTNDLREENTTREDTTMEEMLVNQNDDGYEEDESPGSFSDQVIHAPTTFSNHLPQQANVSKILMTKQVLKWLGQCDPKYREFFVRRLKQFGTGESGRKLAKPLKGCKSIIFEAYLEQKSGFRILWTRFGKEQLLIWFVATHDRVSRLAKLIDDSDRRNNQRLVSASTMAEFQNASSEDVTEEPILLDPFGTGNTPLKLYEVERGAIDDVCRGDWKPSVHLTSQEEQVVKTGGSVLLLGRSGTGKTSCIIGRIDKDREDVAVPEFTQLFVSRSRELCAYVEKSVRVAESCTFLTFERLLSKLGTAYGFRAGGRVFLPSQHVSFGVFKETIYNKRLAFGMDALVVWSCIQSFIKGSIDALRHADRVVPRSEFVQVGGSFGKRRCRLSEEQRNAVYDMFEVYKAWMDEKGLWDESDRIVYLVLSLQTAKTSSPEMYQELKYSRVYCDECQDYTQAEILLFFYLGDPGNFFFAGDPAQSVVDGVHFRFEEIRSVAYHFTGSGAKHGIPDKPLILNVNFRSHAGILNVAASVLGHLFAAYPDSVKQMMKDQGVFKGPRPGVLYRITATALERAMKTGLNGSWLLVHDNVADHWKTTLGYPLLRGIRESKGLEYNKVILLNFFSSLPTEFQKPWRDLLLGRDASSYQDQFPEIEGHLKLLYTAITRCKEQLFFIETSQSKAGDAFVRWVTTTSVAGSGSECLAERCVLEKMDISLTPDQWRAEGLDNAIRAENAVDMSEADGWLEKALYCFQQVNDHLFARKVRVHRASIRLRAQLELQGNNEADPLALEMEVAQVISRLLDEMLLNEAGALGRAALPLLPAYTQQKLPRLLLKKVEELCAPEFD